MTPAIRRPKEKGRSCFSRFLRGDIPGPKDRINPISLKLMITVILFSFSIGDALFEARSLVRDPIPAFEQLETAEGYIKTGSKAKSSFRKVVVITPHGRIGGYYPWWPCTLKSNEWTSKFEGKQAKVWYVNDRIVQLQVGDRIDDSCEYSISVRMDEEAKQTAIRSFVIDFIAFLVGAYLAVLACRQLKSTTSA